MDAPLRVERCPPALDVVARELEVEALLRHAGLDAADAGRAAEPLAEDADQRGLVAGRVAIVESRERW